MIEYLFAALLFTLYFCANIYCSQKVDALYDNAVKKLTFKTGLWLLPFIGALVFSIFSARKTSLRHEGKTDSLSIDEEAPSAIEHPALSPLHLAEHFSVTNGFPLLDWQAIANWTSPLSPEEQIVMINQCKRAWLLHLRDALPSDYHVFEMQDVIVLSPMTESVALAATQFMLYSQQRIAALLKGIVPLHSRDKQILLVLPDQDLYYQYVTSYYPGEGEFALSGGMFVNAGCGHMISHAENLTAMEPVIVHELTHAILSSLQLPVWLDEGIAVCIENRLAHQGQPLFSAKEMQQKHANFWGTNEIQEFWSGRSFHRIDDGQLLSYELARILVEGLSSDWKSFTQFVLEADQSDAGQQAAQRHLSLDLGECIAQLFGTGNAHEWRPCSALWTDGYGKTH